MLVKLEDGQKQLVSLLEVHLGREPSQVLIHLGTTFGQAELGTADDEVCAGATALVPEPADAVTAELPVGEAAGTKVVDAPTIEVVVRVTVETVLKTEVLVAPAEVITEVTGQVVMVTTVISVVVTPSTGEDAAGVVAAMLEATAELTDGDIPTAVVPAEVVSATGLTPEAEGEARLPLGTADGDTATEEATSVSVTGQIVVETGIVDVTTTVDLAGQSVMVGAQLVIVISLVVNTVEVVSFMAEEVAAGEVIAEELSADEAGTAGTEAADEDDAEVDRTTAELTEVVPTAAVVVLGGEEWEDGVEVCFEGEQSKPML